MVKIIENQSKISSIVEPYLGGAHAVRLGVVRDLARGHAHVVVLFAPEPERKERSRELRIGFFDSFGR